MTPSDVFRRIVLAMDAAGVHYMLTGSFASSLHGTPRATQDIDFVISSTPDALREFVRALTASEYYVSEPAAFEALRDEGIFNVIDLATGWKIDLVMLKSRPFSREEFARRHRELVEGLEIFVASAEDVVLAKLEWAKRSSSRRQLEDAAGILRVRGPELDHAYIEKWVRELGLGHEWDEVRRLADGDL